MSLTEGDTRYEFNRGGHKVCLVKDYFVKVLS